MSSNNLDFKITASDGDLNRTLDSVKGKFKELEGVASGGIKGIMNSIGGMHPALGAVAVGVAALTATFAGISAAVTKTVEMTETAMGLSRQLGITTNEASKTAIAMKDLGGSQQDYEQAAKGLVKQIKANEDGLNAMGLATRDAHGNLRPLNDLMVDSIKVVNDYKEGTDRNAAATDIFGKGLDTSSELMLLNKDTMDGAAETMAKYGLEIGENGVRAWSDYDAASDEAGFAIDGVAKVIGDALMPCITMVIENFNKIMPYAIDVLKVALNSLCTVFLAVGSFARAMAEVALSSIYMLTEPIRAIVQASGQALSGDFTGAGNTLSSIAGNVKANWSKTFEAIAADAKKTATNIVGMWSADTAKGSGSANSDGKKNYTPAKDKKSAKPKTQKDPAEQSAMQKYEAELTQQKLAYEKQNLLREFAKEQELQYWRELLAGSELNHKDRLKVVDKAAKLELDIMRGAAKQKQDLDKLHFDGQKAAEMDRIATLEATAKYEQNLGIISNSDYLARMETFNAAKLEAEMLYLQQKTELAMQDPDKNLVLLEQIELQKSEMKNRYRAQELGLQRQQMQAQNELQNTIAQSMEQSFSSSLMGMLNGTMRWRDALANIYKSMYQTFLQEVIIKPLVNMAIRQVKENAMWSALFGKQIAGQVSASTAVAATKATEATSVVTANAAEGASGAAASQASIPCVGPALAVAAAAAMMGFILGMMSGGGGGSSSTTIPSAAGGWDIPDGFGDISAIVHPREMILPAHLADPIRDSVDTGSSQQPIIIQGRPDDTVKVSELASLLKQMKRDFVFG